MALRRKRLPNARRNPQKGPSESLLRSSLGYPNSIPSGDTPLSRVRSPRFPRHTSSICMPPRGFESRASKRKRPSQNRSISFGMYFQPRFPAFASMSTQCTLSARQHLRRSALNRCDEEPKLRRLKTLSAPSQQAMSLAASTGLKFLQRITRVRLFVQIGEDQFAAQTFGRSVMNETPKASIGIQFLALESSTRQRNREMTP